MGARAPNFTTAVKHLESEGYITSRMLPWVNRIKDVGNEANHEMPATTEQQAMDVARLTEQLLRLVYELGEMIEPADDDAAATTPSQ